MKFVYNTLINGLLFYFLLNVFNGIKIAGSDNLFTTVLAGLIFGGLMAGIPTILKFFKLPVTGAATFLMALIVTFIFFFLLYSQFLGLGSIGATNINLGLGGAPIRLAGAVQTMVAATIVTSLSVVGLSTMSKQR